MRPEIELSVIVVGAGAEAARAAAGADARLEVVEVAEREGAGLCELRAEGVKRARGRKIAMLGGRYRVSPRWMQAAMASEWDIASGAVAARHGMSYVGWAVYWSEYARLAPPVEDGAAQDFGLLAGGNAVYRSEVMDAELLAGCLTELEFHAELKRRGARAGRLAGLEAECGWEPGMGEYIAERFRFSVAIAKERRERWRALAAPMLPLLVLLRTGREALRRQGTMLRWAAAAPLILAFGLVQAAGEAWGSVRYPE